jgi:hypothetical protein
MSVNNYKINFNKFGNLTGSTINIPLNMEFQLVDQDEIVRKQFVENEIKNNINPILDYEKVRFSPIISLNDIVNVVNNITYNLHFLNSSNQFNQNSFYGEIGFNNSDIKFRKKSFTNSFLKLNFYDTDITTTQRLLFFVTIFPRLEPTNFAIGPLPPWGTITSAINLKTSFILGDSTINKTFNSEGYTLYYFKDEVITQPKELFMTAEFNNAKNGSTTRFMSTSSTNITIDNLFNPSNTTNNLFTKYILKKVNNKYVYEIDGIYSNNVQINNSDYNIDLYQIYAI